jgi:Na+-driven multidrug efflux pump
VAVGTMWCAYLFTVLALISLPAAWQSHDKIIIVAWIAQTFLQLVLLPIIIVGQNVQAAASDQRGEDTYKDAEAVLHEALQIQAHLQAQDEVLQRLIGGAITGSAVGADRETHSAELQG